MKKLSLSLLSYILIIILLLGLAMDELFDRFFWTADNDPIYQFQTLGQQLALVIDHHPSPEQAIADWQSTAGVNDLQILEASDLPLPEPLWQDLYRGQVLTLETEQGLTLYFWLAQQQRLLAFSPQGLVSEEQVPLIKLILTTSFYLLIVLLLFVWLLPLIRSLKGLRQSALAFGRGDFSVRIQAHRFSYIDEIEHTFNRMAEQIETLIRDNKLISSAVSHDLRTPLARLRFGIDILSDTDDLEERAKYQEHLSNDIDEMQSLVEALLNYARLEQALVTVDKQSVNINALLQAFADTHPKELIQIEQLDQHPGVVLGQENYLKMLFHNILNNALTYGQSQILITIAQQPSMVEVRIHDDGPGIDDEQKTQLFKPFVRGKEQHLHQGYGMGLAIAERIAHWHAGSITIGDSARLSGAEFCIRLPKALR